MLRVEGDSDRHARRDAHVVPRADDAPDDGLADRSRFVLVAAPEDQRELVAAEPERLSAPAKPRADLGQDDVAGGVAVDVVHLLEVVHVDEAERDGRDGRLGPF